LSEVCPGCGESRLVEVFARDSSRASGRKSRCKVCDRARARAFYVANRERVLERAAAKRGRARSPVSSSCSECGVALEGRQRVTCGSSRCRDARFRRLHPESYAARERAKVERRKAARRQPREDASRIL